MLGSGAHQLHTSWGSYRAKVARENEKSVFFTGVGWGGGAVLRGSVCRQLRIVR